MTKEQFEKLHQLIFRVQRIVYQAGGARLPYELAIAINYADDAQSECYQFMESLRPPDTSTERS